MTTDLYTRITTTTTPITTSTITTATSTTTASSDFDDSVAEIILWAFAILCAVLLGLGLTFWRFTGCPSIRLPAVLDKLYRLLCCRPPASPAVDPESAAGNVRSRVFAVNMGVDATAYAEPPPCYELALHMPKPDVGQIVRIVVGTGSSAVVCEFKMAAANDKDSENVPPPTYCGPATDDDTRNEVGVVSRTSRRNSELHVHHHQSVQLPPSTVT